jgi:hypothetical protein
VSLICVFRRGWYFVATLKGVPLFWIYEARSTRSPSYIYERHHLLRLNQRVGAVEETLLLMISMAMQR